MNCPRCGHVLEESFYKGKVCFLCPNGHGHTITLPAVRALSGSPEFGNLLWRKALDAPEGRGGCCPQCGRPMSIIHIDAGTQDVELDICCPCQMIWFDPDELDALPTPPSKGGDAELPDRAREILALHEIEGMNEGEVRPSNAWGFLATLFGFPVELNAPPRQKWPLGTWIIAALCTIIFLFTFRDISGAANAWGMIPSDCFRHGGLTFISSMFLHGSFVHLLGNLYFLLIFGDNVEDALGTRKYLLLILASGIASSFMYIIFPADPNMPCVGASGFISGIIASYAIFFPEVKISLLLRTRWYYRWVSISAFSAFIIWLLYQVIMSLLFTKMGNVAYSAHLGGAFLGAAIGFVMRQSVKEKLQSL